LDLGELRRLLDTYRFADAAIRKHSEAMRSTDRATLGAERAEAFSSLLETASGEPAIAIIQLRALVRCLANSGPDRQLSARLAAMSERHLEELGRAFDNAPQPTQPSCLPTVDSKGWLSDAELRALDHDVNRMAIIGSDYRYLYSNPANAAFHGGMPTSLVGKPLWETTSQEFFATVSKPVFDRCFAGHPAAFVSSHPGRDASQVFSAHLSPILDKQGKTIAALGTMRLVDYVSPTRSS
jgi:hypothetical protein